MTFSPRTEANTAAFADCLFLVGQAWVKRAVGDDQGAVEYLVDAMVMVPDGTVEMILGLIEDRALPEPVPGAMDPWLECCRQAGAGELRLTATRFPSAPAAPALPRVTSRLRLRLPGASPGFRPRRRSRRRSRRPDMVGRIASPASSNPTPSA
jgi:hypothetical protein